MISEQDTYQVNNSDPTARAIELEEERLEKVTGIDDYNMIHERHRIFPDLFENRNHKKILDISAGVGIVADRIKSMYDAEIICNDISPKCLSILNNLGLETLSFNLDSEAEPFPLNDEEFDAIITLSTIEHLYNIDHFISEIRRALKPDGYLYISAPNYNGLGYLLQLLRTGKTFHNPLNEHDKYEFYAHLRYFTYQTMLDYVSRFGFTPEAVYIGVPEGSTKYLKLKENSKLKAFIFRTGMKSIYKFFSPRWASEPVLCFKKTTDPVNSLKPRKVIL